MRRIILSVGFAILLGIPLAAQADETLLNFVAAADKAAQYQKLYEKRVISADDLREVNIQLLEAGISVAESVGDRDRIVLLLKHLTDWRQTTYEEHKTLYEKRLVDRAEFTKHMRFFTTAETRLAELEQDWDRAIAVRRMQIAHHLETLSIYHTLRARGVRTPLVRIDRLSIEIENLKQRIHEYKTESTRPKPARRLIARARDPEIDPELAKAAMDQMPLIPISVLRSHT